MSKENILWPFGAPDHHTPDYAANVTVAVADRLTIVEPAILTGNMQIDLDIDPEVPKGALLLVKIKTTTTEQTTFGAGIEAPVLAGVAGKTKTQLFVYDGTNFVAAGASVQID